MTGERLGRTEDELVLDGGSRTACSGTGVGNFETLGGVELLS